jgi:phospholipase C
MSAAMGASAIQHVFVLMLENRAFDHMLGFSGITGHDAATGEPTRIDGLRGTESNSFQGKTYTVSPPAGFTMPTDPGHEFPNVLEQLCGPAATYPFGGAYPAITRSGFVASYAASGGSSPGEVMRCLSADQLPVLNALAREFVLCDHWHASMPGPTWPNRMFVHAASAGGLDHSPTKIEIIDWETIDGFQFANGTIFDALKAQGITRRLYGGDHFPMVAALKGIGLSDIRGYEHFADDLREDSYPYNYVFIEPSYNVPNDYKGSTSQHPLTDVTLGEGLIKEIYEAIRNSAFWTSSLLIITWDEHGGFYDHAVPPAAVAPGDTVPGSEHNRFGFTFEQYGPRVPAVIISPLCPGNLIDHRLYDHTSILATVENLFGLGRLTARDASATALDSLLSLATPRDTPSKTPPPASSAGAGGPAAEAVAAERALEAGGVSRGEQTVDEGNLPVILHSALRQDLEISGPGQRAAILDRFRAIETRAQAQDYLMEVERKVAAAPGR